MFVERARKNRSYIAVQVFLFEMECFVVVLVVAEISKKQRLRCVLQPVFVAKQDC